MQPADRKQMRQPGIAHGLFVRLGDGAPISAGQRRCNRAGRGALQPVADMPRKASLYRCEGGRRIPRWLDQLDFADCRSGRRKPLEPGPSREVIGTRDNRRRRRHQSGRKAYPRPFAQLRPVLRPRYVDPIGHRPAGLGIPSGEDQPHASLRRLFLALENPPVDPFEARVRDRFRSHHRGARPDQCDPRGQGNADRDDCDQSEAALLLAAP